MGVAIGGIGDESFLRLAHNTGDERVNNKFLHFGLNDPTGNKLDITENIEDTLTPGLPTTKRISLK